MNALRAATILTCFLAGGCSSAVHVYRAAPSNSPPAALEEVKGIPFYIKKGMCKQETVWVEPQYTVSNTTLDGAPSKVLDRESFLKVATPSNAQKGDYWALVESMRSPLRVREEGANDSIDGAPIDISWQMAHGNWSLVSNTAAVESVVDYSQVYYLNSAKPLAGTSQVSYKLAADGTLTEGSAQVQDQTLATVAAAVSSLATDAISFTPLRAAHATGTTPEKEKYPVKTRIFKHTHTIDAPLSSTGSCSVATSGVLNGSFTVTEADDAPGGKPKPDSGAISFQGSVVLPKSPKPPPSDPATPAKPE